MFIPRFAIVLISTASLLSAADHVFAQRIDMRNTMHNLSRTDDSRQICVFCHTPTEAEHAELTNPMWQPSSIASHVFVTYDDIGQMGQAGNDSVGSQSIACLSCHDSTQAFGVSGGSLDHPFAVPYRGALSPEQRAQAREQARRAGRLINPARFVRYNQDFREASRGIIDNRPIWWVSKVGSSSERERTDLPLYVRIDPEDQAEIPFVECASCHDPHTTAPLFLRAGANTQELCLTCHIK